MKQIPVLLKKASPEISFDGVQTQNLHTCPEASKLLRDMIRKFKANDLPSLLTPAEKVQKYRENKPDHIRRQQFKNYVGL